jgi:sirohydrochlorin cobaltochelatase
MRCHRDRRSLALPLVFALLALTQQADAQTGTILIAHGGSAEWNQHVREVARSTKTGGPIEVSFLMGPEAPTHRFQDVARKLVDAGAREIVVVPLLVSSHSGHYEQIRYLAGFTETLDSIMVHHLHMSGIERPSLNVPIRVARALDDASQLSQVLAERALALTKTPQNQALFLVGHGPNSAEEYAAWMDNLRRVADSVQRVTNFRDVRVDLVRDDAPAAVRREAVLRVRELIGLQSEITGQPVIVVPVLVSRGRVSRETFLKDLDGLPVVYTGDPILPHPALTSWIEQRVRETATRNPPPG